MLHNVLSFISSLFPFRPHRNMSTTSDHVRVAKGRCFSMCEPDDLSQSDKLMKPIVVNDGDIPTRFFLYLFPEEPKFNTSEVGEPGFLTPLIKAGKIAEARKQAAVHLKEYPQMESYAGFFNVNPKYNSHLYFWFFPSQNLPSKDPVIIWLQVNMVNRKQALYTCPKHNP